jgi:hypothetical protein
VGKSGRQSLSGQADEFRLFVVALLLFTNYFTEPTVYLPSGALTASGAASQENVFSSKGFDVMAASKIHFNTAEPQTGQIMASISCLGWLRNCAT